METLKDEDGEWISGDAHEDGCWSFPEIIT